MAADDVDSNPMEALLCNAAAGERGAWRELGPLLTSELRQYFARRFDHDRAKDLTQDVLTALARQLPGFEPQTSFRRWVYGIARNHAMDAFREGYRHGIDHDFEIEAELADPTTGASSKLASLQLSTIIQEEVEELEPHLRVVIEHDLADEDDLDALAEREKVTRTTLRTRRHRGHDQLRGRVHDRLEFAGAKCTPNPRPPRAQRSRTPENSATRDPQTPR